MSLSFNNTRVERINGSSISSLVILQQSGLTEALVNFSELLVSNTILNETLLHATGSKLGLSIDSFDISDVSFGEAHPST